MSRERKINCFLILLTILLLLRIGISQVLLWDDVGGRPTGYWNFTFDTLISYGVEICSVSSEGWSNINDANGVWLQCPDSNSYPTALRGILIDYTRYNGRIIMGEDEEFSPRIHYTGLTPLVEDSRWQTEMKIIDTLASSIEATIYLYDDRIFLFPPFTDGIDTIGLRRYTTAIGCGPYAYPFVHSDSTYTTSKVAISYPFLQEANCNSYIVLIMGAGKLDSNEVFYGGADIFQFAKNILLGAASVPGYKLEPWAVPEPFIIQVDSFSNCANPGDTITLTGNNLWQGLNENIGGDIEIHIGDTVVIPIEYSDHAPNCSTLTNTWLKFICPELPDGSYFIQLGHKAILFDGGEIQIPCETTYEPDSCIAHPLPFSPNGDGINDYCKLEYPGMSEDNGVVSIYNLSNMLLREVRNGDVQYSSKGTITWDGKDSEGNVVTNGVYIYIIQADGRIICNGTVYLVR